MQPVSFTHHQFILEHLTSFSSPHSQLCGMLGDWFLRTQITKQMQNPWTWMPNVCIHTSLTPRVSFLRLSIQLLLSCLLLATFKFRSSALSLRIWSHETSWWGDQPDNTMFPCDCWEMTKHPELKLAVQLQFDHTKTCWFMLNFVDLLLIYSQVIQTLESRVAVHYVLHVAMKVSSYLWDGGVRLSMHAMLSLLMSPYLSGGVRFFITCAMYTLITEVRITCSTADFIIVVVTRDAPVIGP